MTIKCQTPRRQAGKGFLRLFTLQGCNFCRVISASGLRPDMFRPLTMRQDAIERWTNKIRLTGAVISCRRGFVFFTRSLIIDRSGRAAKQTISQINLIGPVLSRRRDLLYFAQRGDWRQRDGFIAMKSRITRRGARLKELPAWRL